MSDTKHTVGRKELTASTEIIDLLGEQSQKINQLRSLLRHAVQKTHALSPDSCTPCEQIVAEIGQ